jgi:trehalose 6-phosphate phosphatase
MRYLFYHINEIRLRLKSKKCFLFLDYDGTLSPISKTPELAVLPLKTRRYLESLSKLPGCKIAIVSGRAVADLKRLIKMRNMVFIGNHGWEVKETTAPVKIKQTKEQKHAIWRVCKTLQEKLGLVRNALVEDKGYSISVHYRNASPEDEKLIKKTTEEITSEYSRRKILKIREGKKILEILPATDWHKGSAARSVFAHEAGGLSDFIPVCIGDDKTDEDLFREFREIGITIKVGEDNKSNAEFFLKDHVEVQQLLNEIAVCIVST